MGVVKEVCDFKYFYDMIEVARNVNKGNSRRGTRKSKRSQRSVLACARGVMERKGGGGLWEELLMQIEIRFMAQSQKTK